MKAMTQKNDQRRKPDIEIRRKEIARRVNLISLLVVVLGGVVAVYALQGRLVGSTQLSLIGLILVYILFRLWRLWRGSKSLN